MHACVKYSIVCCVYDSGLIFSLKLAHSMDYVVVLD